MQTTLLVQFSRIAQYRRHAEALRHLSEKARQADSQSRLLALAASFERLADQVEMWERAAADRKAADGGAGRRPHTATANAKTR